MMCEICKGYSNAKCPCCKTQNDSEILRATDELESWYQAQATTCNDEVNERINDIAQWYDQEDTIRDLLTIWANESIAGYRDGKAFAVDKSHWCVLKDWQIVAVKSTDELIKWFVEVDGDFDNWTWMDENEICLLDFTFAKRLQNTELIDHAWSCDG